MHGTYRIPRGIPRRRWGPRLTVHAEVHRRKMIRSFNMPLMYNKQGTERWIKMHPVFPRVQSSPHGTIDCTDWYSRLAEGYPILITAPLFLHLGQENENKIGRGCSEWY